MAIIETFSGITDETFCAVTLFEDETPAMVHISVSGSGPLKLTVFEAVAVREALDEALDLYLDKGDDEETVH
jgi:hypothetical protein